MTKQECAIQYIAENYLDHQRLRYDVVSDKLQIRIVDSLEDASLQDAPEGLQFRGSEYWREMTKHDINSIVCHAAQEYDANITSREVMTALQSDLIPQVHPLREYILSLHPWGGQVDWIDFVASQVKVKTSPEGDSLEDAASGYSLEFRDEGNNATPSYTTLHLTQTASGASASKSGSWPW